MFTNVIFPRDLCGKGLIVFIIQLGLRTGEVPEVAQIVQDKYDMELEMAKTLIQQECDETLESEQVRICLLSLN